MKKYKVDISIKGMKSNAILYINKEDNNIRLETEEEVIRISKIIKCEKIDEMTLKIVLDNKVIIMIKSDKIDEIEKNISELLNIKLNTISNSRDKKSCNNSTYSKIENNNTKNNFNIKIIGFGIILGVVILVIIICTNTTSITVDQAHNCLKKLEPSDYSKYICQKGGLSLKNSGTSYKGYECTYKGDGFIYKYYFVEHSSEKKIVKNIQFDLLGEDGKYLDIDNSCLES